MPQIFTPTKNFHEKVAKDSPSLVQSLLSEPAKPDKELEKNLFAFSNDSFTLEFDDADMEGVKPLQISLPKKVEKEYKKIIFCVIPVFCAYAVLFSMQRKLKAIFGISDDDTSASDEWSFAISFLYMGNLVFRFAHNIIFSAFSARARVYISMCALTAAMLTIYFGVFVFGNRSINLIMAAYSLGGMGIGTYEANMFSSITPLGAKTKLWASFGIPCGVTGICFGAFMLMSWGVDFHYFYIAVACALIASMLLLAMKIPNVNIASKDESIKVFWKNICSIREWFPSIWKHSGIMILNMFSLSLLCPGVMLYIFDGKTVSLLPGGHWTISNDTFFALYNLATFFGGSSGRKVAYSTKNVRSPFFTFITLILASLVGFLVAPELPILAPLAGFLALFSNGFLYNLTCRNIDTNVNNDFNLIALSCWLLLGDLGSIAGTNAMPHIRELIGGQQ
eukprot:TRINITY_DN315_c0_g6_i1.p1 TRINITY_DN315_c0_g6~~TRINITY_DN315_c0_g6_i1.p1  ORF type:complete len:450 (+),score=137.11 TRINITY_DN315_c0_g6_i1:99-1448(+)